MPLIGESRSESAVFGRYVSVDYVQELENGRVEIFLVLCVSTLVFVFVCFLFNV